MHVIMSTAYPPSIDSYPNACRVKPPRYITHEKGERIEVVLDLEDYQELLNALEELEDIRAYNETVARGDEFVDFEEAVKEIEESN